MLRKQFLKLEGATTSSPSCLYLLEVSLVDCNTTTRMWEMSEMKKILLERAISVGSQVVDTVVDISQFKMIEEKKSF